MISKKFLQCTQGEITAYLCVLKWAKKHQKKCKITFQKKIYKKGRTQKPSKTLLFEIALFFQV